MSRSSARPSLIAAAIKAPAMMPPMIAGPGPQPRRADERYASCRHSLIDGLPTRSGDSLRERQRRHHEAGADERRDSRFHAFHDVLPSPNVVRRRRRDAGGHVANTCAHVPRCGWHGGGDGAAMPCPLKRRRQPIPSPNRVVVAAARAARGAQFSSIFRAAMKASCGISTLPNWRIFFLPFFCFSSSLRLRVMSPP